MVDIDVCLPRTHFLRPKRQFIVWRSVQVYHERQELEEEDKGREEVQEIERESQVEEKRSHGHDFGDDMKGLKHLEPQCVCG